MTKDQADRGLDGKCLLERYFEQELGQELAGIRMQARAYLRKRTGVVVAASRDDDEKEPSFRYSLHRSRKHSIYVVDRIRYATCSKVQVERLLRETNYTALHRYGIRFLRSRRVAGWIRREAFHASAWRMVSFQDSEDIVQNALLWVLANPKKWEKLQNQAAEQDKPAQVAWYRVLRRQAQLFYTAASSRYDMQADLRLGVRLGEQLCINQESMFAFVEFMDLLRTNLTRKQYCIIIQVMLGRLHTEVRYGYLPVSVRTVERAVAVVKDLVE